MAPVEPVASQPFAADENFAVLFSLGDRALEFLYGVGIDHGPEEYVALARITDFQGTGSFKQFFYELFAYMPMDIDARRRTTLLVLQSKRRARDPFGGGIEVGGVHHDRRVLAAELEQARLDPLARHAVMDSQPDFLRAGEHDAVDAVVAPQRLTRLGAVA